MEKNKYQNAKVYKIVSADYSRCYIGSTCESLSQRMARHRKKYKQYSSGKDEGRSSNKLFDEFGLENCKIELVEEYPCNSLMELRRREGFHIQNHDCVNTRIAGRTDQEYSEQNREKKNEQNRIYRLNNPDKVKAYREELITKNAAQNTTMIIIGNMLTE